MIVASAVVHLRPGPEGESARQALAQHDRLELGEQAGDRIAVCALSPSRRADACLWDEIHGLAGVTFVDFVFAAFEEEA